MQFVTMADFSGLSGEQAISLVPQTREGMGQLFKKLFPVPEKGELPAVEDVDIITAVRAIYGGYLDAEPFIDFAGNHPILLTTLLLGAIILGGSIGGYIGAGFRTVK